MKHTKTIVVVGALLAVLILILVVRPSTPTDKVPTNEDEAIDVALDFYNDWLSIVNNTDTTSTTTVSSFLASTTVLTPDVQAALLADSSLIFCSTATPERIGVKPIFENGDRAQYMIVPRGATSPEGSLTVVDLQKSAIGWQIAAVTCSAGDVPPPTTSDFTFEDSGRLLKSVPAPLDPNFWHLVYESNGVPGYTIPLTFTPTSMCTNTTTTATAPCDPTTFSEASAASVRGDMTEAGVTVRELTITPIESELGT